jgi:uncharacterized membrane protein
MKTILGIFDDPMAARHAMETLRDGPLPLEDVSIVSRATESGAAVGSDDDVSAGEGAAIGAVWGGLVGLAALLIPGVGPFVAMGALGAALLGAVTGAVVGGIAAALIDFSGIPEAEARRYEALVHAGKTLLAVKARDKDAAEVQRILSSYGAEPVRGDVAASMPPHVAMYDERGRRVDQDIAYTTAGMAASPRGIYDTPAAAGRDPYATRTMPAARARTAGQGWTSGEVVGEGQGQGPRKDTGVYDAEQWVGEGQRPNETTGRKWTSGEVVGEGQGQGPRTDTGTYDAKQWVGEGQDEPPDDRPKR